jgi:DNA-binding phage protein
MGITKDFRETTYARAQRDVAFRKALLTEAVNAYLGGEEIIGKTVLRDFVNATIGFEKLGALAGIPSKSLHRMLSPNGNPSTANFFAVLRVLQEQVGVQLKVRAA